MGGTHRGRSDALAAVALFPQVEQQPQKKSERAERESMDEALNVF